MTRHPLFGRDELRETPDNSSVSDPFPKFRLKETWFNRNLRVCAGKLFSTRLVRMKDWDEGLG